MINYHPSNFITEEEFIAEIKAILLRKSQSEVQRKLVEYKYKFKVSEWLENEHIPIMFQRKVILNLLKD